MHIRSIVVKADTEKNRINDRYHVDIQVINRSWSEDKRQTTGNEKTPDVINEIYYCKPFGLV